MSLRQKKERNEEPLPDESVSEGNKGIDFEGEEEEDIKTMLKNMKKEMKRMEFSHRVELDVLREKHNEELEKIRKEKEPVKVKAKSYLKNKEEDKSDISQPSVVSNRDIVDLIRASNVRVPTLRALDKSNIRKFINDLENYQRLVPRGSRLNIQDLISSKLASSIKLMNRINEEDYMHLDYE